MKILLLVAAFNAAGIQNDQGMAPFIFKNYDDCKEYAFNIYKSSLYAWDYVVEENTTYILFPDNSYLKVDCIEEGISL